jgi:hypothetical protein
MKKDSLIIISIATAWGSSHGGINTFNYELLINLAKVMPLNSVSCIVLNATEDQEKDAENNNIVLINLEESKDEAFKEIWIEHVSQKLKNEYNIKELEWWIGHDIFTGKFSLQLRNKTKKGKVSIIMHSSYDDYEYIKYGVGKEISNKHETQKSIFKEADVCFSIGPLLRKRLIDFGIKDPKIIVPGLNIVDISPSKFKINALSFGRFEKKIIL